LVPVGFWRQVAPKEPSRGEVDKHAPTASSTPPCSKGHWPSRIHSRVSTTASWR